MDVCGCTHMCTLLCESVGPEVSLRCSLGCCVPCDFLNRASHGPDLCWFVQVGCSESPRAPHLCLLNVGMASLCQNAQILSYVDAEEANSSPHAHKTSHLPSLAQALLSRITHSCTNPAPFLFTLEIGT